MEAELSHPLYTFVSKKEEADAEAWAWVDKTTYKRVYFKFPQIGEDEVRCNIIYSALCRSDLFWCTGHWGQAMYPCVPGHEIFGQVTMVGSKVTKHKVGDTVAIGPFRNCCTDCVFCTNKRSNICPNEEERFLYGLSFGGYATAIQVRADHSFTVPEGMNLKESAPLLCAGVTTFVPIQDYAKATSNVAVAGIGGLGHLGLKFARASGCKVTAIVTSKDVKPERKEAIKKMGADTVLTVDELAKHQNEFDLLVLTSPDLSRESMDLCMESLVPQGTIALVAMGGTDGGQKFNPFKLVAWDKKIAGHVAGSIDEQEGMLRFAARNNIVSQNEHFSFDDFGKAIEHLRSGRPEFRCVVDVASYSKSSGLWK